MKIISTFIDIILHLDVFLGTFIQQYGFWVYVLLFVIVFLETGLVFTPFLPGDSLLFTAGTFAALGSLDVILVFFVLVVAAILGDSVNYMIGHYIGQRLIEHPSRFFSKKHLERTQHFYDKHGAKTIVLARFVPIVRSFAPFVAGIGRMHYVRFLAYNIIGGVLWVGLFVFGGYFFGNMPFVKDNFSAVIVVIILISLIPMVVEYWKHRKE